MIYKNDERKRMRKIMAYLERRKRLNFRLGQWLFKNIGQRACLKSLKRTSRNFKFFLFIFGIFG
jgi:hypothetical protein